MSVTKGYTFGATELVTHTKLHSLIDSATIDLTTAVAIGTVLPAAGCFTSATATGGKFGTGVINSITATGLCITQTSLTATASAEQVPFTCNRFFNINLNGLVLYIPCASATA